jgi:hypothetical protein
LDPPNRLVDLEVVIGRELGVWEGREEVRGSQERGGDRPN